VALNPREIFNKCRYVNKQGWVFAVEAVDRAKDQVDYTVISVFQVIDGTCRRLAGVSCRTSVEEFAGRMVDIAR
jgi:hypothetical protein